jgi:hypothetical protein
MGDKELTRQITDLKLLIEVEEDNYKTAIESRMPMDTLKQLRNNIKKLKADLQILLDKESVDKTGELPEGGVT